MALSSNLAMLRWLCVVMMFGPECQLNFQIWQLLLCPGSQGLLRTEAIYLTSNRDVFYRHLPNLPSYSSHRCSVCFPESKSACEALTQQNSSDISLLITLAVAPLAWVL